MAVGAERARALAPHRETAGLSGGALRNTQDAGIALEEDGGGLRLLSSPRSAAGVTRYIDTCVGVVVIGGWDHAGMDAMRRRVYGSDHDDPHPYARPGHAYVELVAGPLDGLLLDVTGWSAAERAAGAALITEIGAHGSGGRTNYAPRPGTDDRWDWRGDTP